MHLAVAADKSAIPIDDGNGIVIEPFGPLLEQAHDDGDVASRGELLKPLRRRARYGLGQLKQRMILRLAEIPSAEQLGKTDDRRSLVRRCRRHT